MYPRLIISIKTRLQIWLAGYGDQFDCGHTTYIQYPDPSLIEEQLFIYNLDYSLIDFCTKCTVMNLLLT